MYRLAVVFLALCLSSASAQASSQLYIGPGVSWTPGAERPFGGMLDVWHASATRPENARTFGVELGPFLHLRFPGFREFRGSAGIAGGVMWGGYSDSAHLAFTQIDAEVGMGVGGGTGVHLGVSGSKALDPWLAGPRCMPTGNNPGCIYSNWALSYFRLHPRLYLTARDDGVEYGGDLALTMGWLPQVYLD